MIDPSKLMNIKSNTSLMMKMVILFWFILWFALPFFAVEARSVRGSGRVLPGKKESERSKKKIRRTLKEKQQDVVTEFSRYPFVGFGGIEPSGKNVILVVGDGMGWESIRAGAIARQIIDELDKKFDCPVASGGCPDNREAKASFIGRNLNDYYNAGKGSGLSWQKVLDGYAIVTNSVSVKSNYCTSTFTILLLILSVYIKGRHASGSEP